MFKKITAILILFVLWSIDTFSQEVLMEVEGGLKIGNYTGPDTTLSTAGILRWNSLSSDFEGWNGLNWKSLTSSGSAEGGINEGDGRTGGIGINNQAETQGPSWSIDGNSGTGIYVGTPRMGTTDNKPVVFITNNLVRLRIKEFGDISINKSLEIGNNLSVRQNVYLNTFGGQTINNGPFTVTQTSPTYLTGTLTVDSLTQLKSDVHLNETGGETINNGSFTVTNISPTYLTGTLTVDSITQLKSDVHLNETGGETINNGPFTVTNTSPSYLSGILTVDSITQLKSDVHLNETGGETINNGPFTVTNISPTSMSGTLSVDSITLLKSDVRLNLTGGTTTNFGAFTVDSLSPTLLSGTLTTDRMTLLNKGLKVYGSSTINGLFKVDKDYSSLFTGQVLISDLTRSDSSSFSDGALVVDGGVGIGQNLNVKGDVVINGKATFGGEVGFTKPVTISAPDESTSTSTGALIVSGGVGIGKRLNVGGQTQLNSSLGVRGNTNLESTLDVDGHTSMNTLETSGNTMIGGTLDIEGITSINNSSPSVSKNTGALKVAGGVGIQLNLNVGGMLNVSGASNLRSLNVSGNSTLNSLDVNGHSSLLTLGVSSNATIRGTLNVTGISTFDEHAQFNSSLTAGNTVVGSFESNGSALFTNIATFSGLTTMNNGLTITNDPLYVTNSGDYIASFTNNSDNNGINISIAGNARNANNYVNFQNGSGSTVGRIEGQTIDELNNGKDFYHGVIRGQLVSSVTIASIAAVGASIGFGAAVATAAGAYSSSTACAGFGACITSPIPSLIVAATAGLIAASAGLVNAAIGVGVASDQLKSYDDTKKRNIGVTYQSGNGDYAEWLPKANKDEDYLPGYVVGVKNGMISLDTDNADKILAISTNPILLGMMQNKEDEKNYEKVAFMGQVPVHVIGKVEMGDYIIPSGNNDGLAIAVSPDKMTAADYAKIVGMAWSESVNDAYDLINVAIGLNDGDISKLVAIQNEEIEALYKDIEELQRMESESDAILASLIPEYKIALRMTDEDLILPNAGKFQAVHNDDNHNHEHNTPEIYDPEPGSIVYFKPTMDQLYAGYEMAKQNFINEGGDLNTHPFWSNMDSDATLRNSYFKELESNFENVIHVHKQIDNGASIPALSKYDQNNLINSVKNEIVNREKIKVKSSRNSANKQ